MFGFHEESRLVSHAAHAATISVNKQKSCMKIIKQGGGMRRRTNPVALQDQKSNYSVNT